MLVARKWRVGGRVQGVGFRAFVQNAAMAEGLHGWVANAPDGDVEIQAEGDAESVDRFELRVRRGPAGARVERVRVDAIPPSGRPTGFRIEHWPVRMR